MLRRRRLAPRPYDWLGRYGGEEFLITAPGCTWNDAMAVAERIRSSISAEPVNTGSGVIFVTVRWGLRLVVAALARIQPRLLRLLTSPITEQKGQAVTELDSRTGALDSWFTRMLNEGLDLAYPPDCSADSSNIRQGREWIFPTVQSPSAGRSRFHF